MGTRKHDRYELMIEREKWTEPAIELFSEKKKKIYQARKQAVDMYINGESLEDINSKTGIDKSHIVKYVDRCRESNDEGIEAGYMALCPGMRLSTCTDALQKRSSTGNFNDLLKRFEELKQFIEGNYFGYESYTYEKNMSLANLHKKFLKKCQSLGLGMGDYPFNSKTQGYQSLRRYVKELEICSVKLANRRTDKDAAQKAANAGYGENKTPIPVVPYASVQVDGHKMDILYTTEIELEDGTVVRDICERCWFLAVIDSATRCLIGYHMSQEPNYNQYDLIKSIKNSIVPHKKMKFTIKGIDPPEMEGFPSEKYPETEYALFDEIMLDNAKSHLSGNVIETISEKLGISLNYGSVATPETRAIVERFFETIEIKGIHTLPGTTGSNAKDTKRKNPREDAIKYGITFDDICQIMESLICEYNNTPHSALLNRTPLEVMKEKLESGMLPHIATKEERAVIDKMLYITKEVTVRGNIKEGKRPYITYLGARYRGRIISLNYNFLGRRIILKIDPDDISSLDAYRSDGVFIEKITAVGEYGNKKHSIKTRRMAMRLANKNKKEHSEFSTPLKDLEQSLRERAVKSKRARTRTDIIKREQGEMERQDKKPAELIQVNVSTYISQPVMNTNMTSEESWIEIMNIRKRRVYDN